MCEFYFYQSNIYLHTFYNSIKHIVIATGLNMY